MSLKNTEEIVDGIYFMLKMDEKGAYIVPANSDGIVLESFDIEDDATDSTSKILKYIKGIKEDSFFIDWEKDYPEAYITEHCELIDYLIDNPRFVNEKMEPFSWCKRNNTLALIIKEQEEGSNILTTQLLLNDSISEFTIINEDLILANNTFYIIDMVSNTFHTLRELVCTMDTNGLENFLTLTLKYFKDIEIEYKDYKIVQGEKHTPRPQLVIEKISYDNSLYLQVTLMVSGMSYEFL